MNYDQLMGMYTKAFPYYNEIYKLNLVDIYYNQSDGSVYMSHKPENAKTYYTQRAVIGAKKIGKAATVETFNISKVIGRGPKIFKFNSFDFRSLEQTTLNVKIEDYVQPFPTIIIELPNEYAESKYAINLQGDEIISGQLMPGRHYPVFVILTLVDTDPKHKIIVTTIFLSSSQCLSLMLFGDDDIEDMLDKVIYGKPGQGTFEMSDSEKELQSNVLRASINAVLAMEEVGIKKIGPRNQNQYSRLLRYREKARTNEDISKAALNLKVHPILYSFDREVILARQVSQKEFNQLNGDEFKRQLDPHHRRGHHRRQHYGPKGSLIKRIRIPPVFVNAHLYMGESVDAVTRYKG